MHDGDEQCVRDSDTGSSVFVPAPSLFTFLWFRKLADLKREILA
jgi:hypothetical protein